MNENDALRRHLEAQIKRLDGEIERARKRLDGLVERKGAYEVVLQDQNAAGVPKPRQTRAMPKVAPDELNGLSREAAAVLIAERSGGTLDSTLAREIMSAAGGLPSGSTNAASTALYAVLSTSDRFKKAGRGKWRLLPKVVEEAPLVTAEPDNPFLRQVLPSPLAVNGR